MPFVLDQVVPWGRSFDEYLRMFALTDADLNRSILGCADGPAAFNAELTLRGGKVMSCDPLYGCSPEAIQARIENSFGTVLEQTRLNTGGFVWSRQIPDASALGQVRMAAMRLFLADFPTGKEEGRYVAAELPRLPFRGTEFDLAISSHFLFLYESLGLDFHIESVLELCRVASEVRIFPLLQLNRQRSPFLGPVIESLESVGCSTEVVAVSYEFQCGANEMLRIARG